MSLRPTADQPLRLYTAAGAAPLLLTHRSAARQRAGRIGMSFSEIVTGWQTPNYVNPITRGPELWIVIGIFLFLASLAVGVRLYTRIFVRHWFGFDDALLIFSLVSENIIKPFPLQSLIISCVFSQFAAYAVTATVIVGNVKYGWNRHFWDVPESDYTRMFTAHIIKT